MLHFFLIFISFLSWGKISFSGFDYQSKKSIEIKSNNNKLILFLSAVCPCSHSHIELIKKLRSEFKEIDFIGVHSNQNEDEKTASDYFTKVDLGFPVLRDLNANIADELNANKTPHAFILDQNNNILYQGGLTNSATAYKADTFFVANALNELKLGKEISIKEGRTLGCMISREKDE